MVIKLYTVDRLSKMPGKDSPAFVTKWQAIWFGNKLVEKYGDTGFYIDTVKFSHSNKFLGYFHGIPLWVEFFIKGFFNFNRL